MPSENVIKTDVLVIGGGMSGIFAAMKARTEGVDVTLVEKGYVTRAGAVFSAEGFFCVFNPEWGHNLNDWKAQIAKAGDYMNNPEWTEICLKDSYERYRDLESWGVKFLTGEDGEQLIWRRGVIESRILGNGWTYIPKVRQHILKSGVNIMDRTMITDLIKQDGRVIGAVGFNIRSGDFIVFEAKATVICTGGGDGEAMAYRAGAAISGKEFVTGTGAYSYAGKEYYGDKGGDERISLEGKAVKPLQTWDLVASHYIDKYVDAEGRKVNRYTFGAVIHAGRGPVLWNMDAATPQEIADTLREVKQGGIGFKLERAGFDMTKGGLYQSMFSLGGLMGGSHGSHGGGSGISSTSAKTMGETGIPGLFAAGDAYNARTVGAKYPFWGFGLRNATVTGARAGRLAAIDALDKKRVPADRAEIARLKNNIYAPLERVGGFDKDWVVQQLRNITGGYYVRLVRRGDRLKAALTLVEFLKSHIAPMMYAVPKDGHGLALVHETKSLILSAETALRASIHRTESRGSHYREDYPRRDDPKWLATVNVREKDGKVEVVKVPLPKKWWPDLSVPYRERYPMEYAGED